MSGVPEGLGSLALQRAQVGQGPQVPQLVGIDDSAHGLDLAFCDVEHHHAAQPALGVEEQRTGLPIDLFAARREAPKRAPARSPAISVRATLARPWTARAIVGALPPLSLRSTTS